MRGGIWDFGLLGRGYFFLTLENFLAPMKRGRGLKRRVPKNGDENANENGKYTQIHEIK